MPDQSGRVQTVEEAVAWLAELDVPESALAPIRQWIDMQGKPKTGRCPDHCLTYCGECGYV